MKKLITLLFAVGLVTAASAQSGDRYRNDSRNNNSYQSSPYSNNNQSGYSNQYPDSRNSQWDGRGDHDRYDRDRRQAEQRRYEMMMRRNRGRYNSQGRYDSYSPYGYSRKPVFQLSIGLGGRRY